MKKMVCTLALLLIGAAAMAQNYIVVNSEKVFKSIAAYNTAIEELDNLAKNYQQWVDAKFEEVEKLYNSYQQQKASLSASTRTTIEQQILQKEEEAQKYQQEVFGDEGTMMKLREEKLKPIQDRVFKLIDEYAVKNGYGLVLDIASNPTVLYYAPATDKTQEIIKIVNNN